MGEFSLSDDQKLMKQQIENTIEIIDYFRDNQELSYAALLNALLSLVLLPFESAKRRDKGRIWQGKYEDVKKNIGFTDVVFAPIVECRNGKPKISYRNQYSFIRKFRNAIAHQHIQLCLDENKLISVTFFNVFRSNCLKCNDKSCKLKKNKDGVEDFRVSFTYDQLHAFALFVAKSYLRSITGEER